MSHFNYKIIVTGGGTAGHVTPLLAVVDELRKQQPTCRIRYIGQGSDKATKKLVAKNVNIEKQHNIFAGKLRRFHGRGVVWYLQHPSLILRNFRDIFLVFLGIFQSLFYLIAWRPSVVFVKGGFVGLPVGLAAVCLRISIVTHDSDSVPGLTNRILSKFVKKSAVAMPAKTYSKYYDISKTIEVGVPIDAKFFIPKNETRIKQLRQKLNIRSGPVLTIVGGSLGAVRLNDVMKQVVLDIVKQQQHLYIFWATGQHDHTQMDNFITNNKLVNRVILEPYFNNLDEVFGVSNIVISRSGATTLAELAALSIPTILVPNPVLTAGHQVKNALVLKAAEAAIVINEEDLLEDSKLLENIIMELLRNQHLTTQLAKNINQFANPRSAQLLAQTIVEAI